MHLLWQFEGGEVKGCPLEALESTTSHQMVLPVEMSCEEVLRWFARQSALELMDLWDPLELVRHYLETGDESLRDAAWALARDAPWTKECDEAWFVARDAARNTARDTARFAAWYTAKSASKVTTWGTQQQSLVSLLAPQVVLVPAKLLDRLEMYRCLRYERPVLLPLYVGQWWNDGLEGLDLVDM